MPADSPPPRADGLLTACPFTDALHHGPAFPPKIIMWGHSRGSGYFVSCPACEARGPLQPTEQMAAEAWSKGAALLALIAAKDERIKALEALCGEADEFIQYDDGDMPMHEYEAIEEELLKRLRAAAGKEAARG